MNINDFVILPGSKNGFSVKLKAKSVRELQLEKVQLELENKEMEKKLKQLQSNMNQEKQERERANGYRWKSGQIGLGTQSQTSQKKENVKVSSGKVKLRILKEHTQASEAAKQLLVHKTVNDAATEKPKVKGKACGQCEMKTALLVCLECGEDYCPGCFARVHQKGALKLHRTTSLQAKAYIPIRKLEAAQQFLKAIDPKESNAWLNNGQKKEVNDAGKNTTDCPSSLPQMPTANIEESYTVTSTEGWSEIESGGSLLNGTFDEEESAKSFQQALDQWRAGNDAKKTKEECSCQVEAENSGTCHVQTSPPVMKKPTEIEFKEDSLKYMERLLIKKHRRTPLEKLPDSIIMNELEVKKSITEIPNTWSPEEEDEEEEDEEEDIAIAFNTVKEMREYWVNVSGQEEPEALLTNSEPSLKITILEDSYKEESEEESADFIVIEAGSDELIYSGTKSKTQKTETDILAHTINKTTRSFTPFIDKHEEILKAGTSSPSERANVACGCSTAEEMVPSNICDRAKTKDKWVKTRKKSSCMPYEQTSPPELPAGEPFSKDYKGFVDMHETSPRQLTPKDSLLLQVALREKPVCNPYRGLEGFFTMGTGCQQASSKDSVPLSYTAKESPCSSSVSFSGSEQWTRHLSLREYADESVAQAILKKELDRPSSRLGRQTPNPRISTPVMSIGNTTPRPYSANIPFCRIVKHDSCPSSVIEAASKNSNTRPLSQAAFEISEIEGVDVTENDDPFVEYYINQQALIDLEHELQNIVEPWEKLSGLISGDFNINPKITHQNFHDFHNNHEIKDYGQGDAVSICDENYTDDEEDQMDKKQVIELH